MGTLKRRGRDSNPRYPDGYNSLAGSPIRPLSHLSRSNYITERVGFEPTEPRGSTVFKTASFDLSDISPDLGYEFTLLTCQCQYNKCSEQSIDPSGFSIHVYSPEGGIGGRSRHQFDVSGDRNNEFRSAVEEQIPHR